MRMMRAFLRGWPIRQTVSAESKSGVIAQTASAQSSIFQTLSEIFNLQRIAAIFPLTWSWYVRLLCTQHNHAVAHYTLDGLPDQVLAAEYRFALPDEFTLAAELERVQIAFASRGFNTGNPAKVKKSPAKKKDLKQNGGKQ